MTGKTAAKPPKTLSAEAKRFYKSVIAEYAVDDCVGLHYLAQAATAYDEVLRAEAVVRKEGLTTKDKWGQTKQHPIVPTLRDSRNAMLKCIRAMNLDIQPPSSPFGDRR
jgi:P27 family predicted phage terminase small subunit